MGVQTGRIGSLDGLRGVAALVVLIHHSLVSIGPLGDVYFGRRAPDGLGWLVYSPLHLIWAGPEAVYVFFILSGLVLTLPALRRPYTWKAYYPSRLVRLYMPVAAAVVFAVVCALVIPRDGTAGRGVWMENHDIPVSVFSAARNMTLISPDWLNPPLWSLRWEVAFSVLLPAYLYLTRKLSRCWPLVVVMAIAVSSYGLEVGDKGLLSYLPIFLIGSALAVALQDGGPSTARVWPWLMGIGLVGITSSWWLGSLIPGGGERAEPLVLASATLVVISAVRWRGARAFLETPSIRWLGKISFSLYLIHDPIVVGISTLLPAHLAVLTPVIAIPLSLAAAVLFHRLVEAPAHRLAKRVGSRLSTSNSTRPDDRPPNAPRSSRVS